MLHLLPCFWSLRNSLYPWISSCCRHGVQEECRQNSTVKKQRMRAYKPACVRQENCSGFNSNHMRLIPGCILWRSEWFWVVYNHYVPVLSAVVPCQKWGSWEAVVHPRDRGYEQGVRSVPCDSLCSVLPGISSGVPFPLLSTDSALCPACTESCPSNSFWSFAWNTWGFFLTQTEARGEGTLLPIPLLI